eukprot:TRINITY_DN6881_c0_g1_i1.p1 TRINITY_DN6881_c0_g1~~TRINITY_DN6881_c0_g1_i1.p1  ORF type:complete len:1077 (-),score=188.76 TRINITY_DN6881_c0_g1_i1:102-3332(-)
MWRTFLKKNKTTHLIQKFLKVGAIEQKKSIIARKIQSLTHLKGNKICRSPLAILTNKSVRQFYHRNRTTKDIPRATTHRTQDSLAIDQDNELDDEISSKFSETHYERRVLGFLNSGNLEKAFSWVKSSKWRGSDSHGLLSSLLIQELCIRGRIDDAITIYTNAAPQSLAERVFVPLISACTKAKNVKFLRFFLLQLRDRHSRDLNELLNIMESPDPTKLAKSQSVFSLIVNSDCDYKYLLEVLRAMKEDDSFIISAEIEEDVEQREDYREDDIASDPSYDNLREAQIELERSATEKQAERYNDLTAKVVRLGKAAELAPSTAIILQWYQPLFEVLKEKLEQSNPSEAWYCLSQISPDKLAVLTIHQTLGQVYSNREGATFSRVVRGLGEAVQAELSYQRFKIQKDGRFLKYYKNSRSPSRINKFAKKTLESSELDMKLKVQLGAELVKLLLDTAKISVRNVFGEEKFYPAFIHELNYETGDCRVSLRGKIRCHPHVFKDLDQSHVIRQIKNVRHHPMIVSPEPWEGPKEGGYLRAKHTIIRYESHLHQVKPLEEISDTLDTIYHALNILGSTSWKINDRIFQAIREAWDQGGGIGDIPSRKDIPLPEMPTDQEQTSFWYKTCRKTQKYNSELHSLRSDLLLKLQVAEQFLGKTMYLPHNMDFRGRVYPLPPHLNHMGSDLCRGLLIFGEGMELGERGLYWLKIQLSNLYGLDKVPFSDRIDFVNQNLDNIFDSADHPLDGSRWWLKASSPWQCLAACFELTNALRSPDPHRYVSYLPIHQDGTCNGLQHYAALGGDLEGAKSVNLVPSESPQDVYSNVCKLVLDRITVDAENGSEIAKLLLDKVDRKVVKQTIMTSVYGVTFIGARKQIFGQLKGKPNISDEQLYQASVYVAKHTFDSLKEMFSGARQIMEWLGACAKLIAKSGEHVTWVTPLGLPVTQPYKKPKRKQIVNTVLQKVTLNASHATLPVDTHKQKSAFPPNFIHSLDSTHMMLTAIECNKRGINYASVHDSFWTHASHVDDLSVILRDKFVEMHERPILKQVRDFWVAKFPNVQFPPVPELGFFDLKLVKKSPYFFH